MKFRIVMALAAAAFISGGAYAASDCCKDGAECCQKHLDCCEHEKPAASEPKQHS